MSLAGSLEAAMLKAFRERMVQRMIGLSAHAAIRLATPAGVPCPLVHWRRQEQRARPATNRRRVSATTIVVRGGAMAGTRGGPADRRDAVHERRA